jgi:EAL domain-containing protein (putative c-di-GMP-specific phosphodiesterase class I)
VSPAEFIPIVEEIGLMEEFGSGVLRRACAACASWPEGVSVSVNMSSSQFRYANIEKTILGALDASGLAPERLDIEITESTLLDDRGDTRRTLEALRARGLRISLDDFGTGYSSLSYLLSFPLDRVKIDRSFTLGLGIHERASILVESVAAMSRKLGMGVLIEGVETERQMRVIEGLGTITEAQGFLFSRPVAEIGVDALLARERRYKAA